jgi:hypothetical protein
VVDVGERQCARALPVQTLDQGLDRRLRTGIDEHAADLETADHVRATEMVDVDQTRFGHPPNPTMRPWTATDSPSATAPG